MSWHIKIELRDQRGVACNCGSVSSSIQFLKVYNSLGRWSKTVLWLVVSYEAQRSSVLSHLI
jgi:hypothetical protein